ncbi:MAG: MFS transporter [Deltaproteobacteria bacterium]|nr:MFS transporter [Deltaproteobacteria bacterium]
MNLAERRWLRLFTLGLLFFAQGIPWGFMAITLYGYLAERDASPDTLANITTVTVLPFAFKWVAGPIVDAISSKRFGRRRPWIVGAQLMMAVTLASLLLLGDFGDHLDAMFALMFAHTVFNALQNVAVDGLAIDLLDKSERGRASGIMYGSKFLGGMAGSAGIGIVVAHAGLRAGIVVMVIVLLAIMLVPLFVKERAHEEQHKMSFLDTVKSIPRAFSTRGALIAALVMTWMNLALGMLNPVSGVLFMQHLHWKQEEYSAVTGGFGLPAGFVASLCAGFLADLVGRRRLAAIACIVTAAGWLVFAFNDQWWHHHGFIYLLSMIEPLANATLIVCLWALCMDTTDAKVGATQFAAYTSLTNLSTVVGAKLLGANVLSYLSFQQTYIFAALLQLVIVGLLPFVKPRQRM